MLKQCQARLSGHGGRGKGSAVLLRAHQRDKPAAGRAQRRVWGSPGSRRPAWRPKEGSVGAARPGAASEEMEPLAHPSVEEMPLPERPSPAHPFPGPAQ